MARLGLWTGLWTGFCIAYVCAAIRTNHYAMKQKSLLTQSRSSVMCVDTSVNMCAVKCSSIDDCESFCMDGKKTCYTLTMDEITTPTEDNVLVECSTDIGLYEASIQGKLHTVQKIVSESLEDINCRGNKKRTPVMAAARMKSIAVFDYLVSQGCDLSAVDEDNANGLHIACKGGNIEIVRKLTVKDIFDIESRDNDGWTPVMHAVFNNHINLVKFLVHKRCNMRVLDKENDNILHLACMYGDEDLVKYILQLNIPGVDIESRGHYGWTPFLTAARCGNFGVVKFLVGKRCNLNALANDNRNILHVACINDNVDMVIYILQLNIPGVGIESRSAYRWTPVVTAAYNDNNDVCIYLISKGCNLKALDENNDTILHVAHDNVELVKYILKQKNPGIDIESRGSNGKTPVLKAARHGSINMIRFLARKGCNMKALDNDSNNILHLACMDGDVDVVKFILKKKIPGIDIDSIGENGMTPKMIAREYGHTKLAKFLSTIKRKACLC